MKIALAGASGLIGSLVLPRLLQDARVTALISLGRRKLPASDAKLTQIETDFTDLPLPQPGQVDSAICALGTTIRKAGSQIAFRRVDVDAVLAFARWAQQSGASRFSIVTSAGASLRSGNFYLRTKGEVEAALADLGFRSLTFIRPGLLLGERAERRPVERAMIALAPLLNPLLIGPLALYRSVSAETAATALLNAALDSRPGIHAIQGLGIPAAAVS